MSNPPGKMVSEILVESLSPSEHKVLTLMAKGLSNREIADQLYKTEETVKCQLKAVYCKLGLSTGHPGTKRVLAVRKAEALGLL